MLKKVMKFSAPWCAPCKTLAPIFHEITTEEKYKDLEFYDVDIEEDEKMYTEKYAIRSVPTIVLADENGESIKKIIGLLPKEKIEKEIDEAMSVKPSESEAQ